ncbi:type II toxin-antitoxin system RelB/DinJ family antitoxin [Sutterella faecalis]|uniref:Type II toxin-antitoxin system RelB/DinJ family antitoxin n=2 Tax=Sutterella TaxID=40544 RepID=A0AAI9WNB5_9BURK|nr:MULTISPECIES: type II toxin-antitoxin system RelB/DinJ family antitoxin [Sutterella]KAB7651401.1 type II toxin-antitoxin system RelB/DinJ family antitoxin [Sutterella seckii]QDA53857.1 type II toxin-antitoxin system RelB/DinJ family antitoxin [Sutterella faecalis]
MSTVQRAFLLEEALNHQFCIIAERLGSSPSDVLRMFVTSFVANKGLPFTFRLPDDKAAKRVFNSKHPNIITPPIRNGHAVLPASWRDDDEE